MHSVLSGEAYEPDGQAVHAVDAAARTLPVGQGMHWLLAPGTVPAAQRAHAVPLASE